MPAIDGVNQAETGSEAHLSQARLRSILDRVNTPFLEIDATGHITEWNAAAANTFGWPLEEALGKSASSLILPPRNRDRLAQAIKIFISERNDSASHLPGITVVDRDGREFVVELLLFDSSSGNCNRTGIFVHPMNDLKRIEELQEQRHRDLMNQLGEAYSECDLRGRLTFVNDAYRNVYNLRARDERRGVDFRKILPPETIELFQETYTKVYKTGKPARIEYPTITHGRGYVFNEQLVSLKRDSQGNPTGFMVMIRDATERHKYQTALAKSKEEAEAASKAKGEFLANMSHEIRTPLNGVIGMLELTKYTQLTTEQTDLLNMAQVSAHSLLAVINDILDFSKIEAGKLEFDCIDFDIAETVAEAMSTMAIRAHQKKLELAFEVAPEIPRFLRGDPLRLKQVILNLVGNAIKFTERGEVVLRVSALHIAAESVELDFSVTDSGIGIPPDKQELIFDAFSQADASTTRKYGGTGLGLAICARIVKLMGGKIWVESRVGKGSRFSFSSKLAISLKQACEQSQIDKSKLRGMPVLIVDDNLTNRRILEGTLTAWGMATVTAESGAAALDIMRRAANNGMPFPMVLVDFQMPEMDGFELIEKIRSSSELSSPAIMMLTSDDYNGTAQRCREVGVSAHLLKPIRESELLAAVFSLVQPAARQLQRPAPSSENRGEGDWRLNILLAEDNVINQKVAIRLLERAGHRVVVADNGKIVLEKLKEEAFDLLLMDVQMPEMDGFDATAAIRMGEQRTGTHLPIIAMTAHAMKGDQERCLNAGMDDYVTKPVDREKLSAAINRVMGIAPANLNPLPSNQEVHTEAQKI